MDLVQTCALPLRMVRAKSARNLSCAKCGRRVPLPGLPDTKAFNCAVAALISTRFGLVYRGPELPH
jgi:hypothetical protein